MQIAASTKGVNRENLRTVPIQQVVANPFTTTAANPYGNTLVYQFPYPQRFDQAEVALANLYCFYSWYNVSAAFGNNKFQYNWPLSDGSYQTFTVTIPDGFYQLDDLNSYFEQVQVANGTYLTSTTTNQPVYFLYWAANTTYYRVTVTSEPVPSSATGYILPDNYPAGLLPPTNTNPQLVILSGNGNAGTNTPGLYSFSKTLGFSPGTYPPNNPAAAYFVNGQFAPIIESTSNVFVQCNLVNTNGLSQFGQVLYTFSPQVAFGSQVQEKPFFPLFMQVADGQYNQIIITLRDENFIPLNIQDPHISLVLLLRGN
jgi:hypothetical protein